MKHHSILIWILVVLFIISLIFIVSCSNEELATINPTPTLDCHDLLDYYCCRNTDFGIDDPFYIMEPPNYLNDCIVGIETPDLLVWLENNNIVTGLPAELKDSDPENDPADFLIYIGDVVLMDTPVTDILCSVEMVDIVGKFGLYLDDPSEDNKRYLTTSFNNLIDLVVDWTLVKAAVNNITDLLTWEQVSCLGSALSCWICFLLDSANSTWVQDEVDAMLADLDLSGAQDFLDIFGLTEEDLNGVLAIAAEEIQKLVNKLLEELIQENELTYLIILMKCADTYEPTHEQINGAIDDLAPFLSDNIIPSILETLTSLLDALPELEKDNIVNLINNLSPSTLVDQILDLIGLPSCS